MRVRVYPDGNFGAARDYDATPGDAVLHYCAQENGGGDLIVEPLDTEARDQAGWHDDGCGPVFRMFKASAVVQWTVEEVDTLNPYYTGPDTRVEKVSKGR